jgi:hypothetical protein
MKNLWEWVKKHWKGLLEVAGVALGAILAIFGIRSGISLVEGLVRTATLGKVKRADTFQRLDPDHVAVKTELGWETVDLTSIAAPGHAVKADNVKAIQLDAGKPAKVEVHNATIDEI